MAWWSWWRRAPVEEAKAVDMSPALWAAINGGWGLPTKSGATVSTSTALGITAYYRAVLSIAEGLAQLPVMLYRRSEDGRGSEPAIDHPLYDVLLHQANVHQDAFQFFRTMLMHAAGAGNGVAYKVMVAGQVRELIPIRPENVSIDIDPVFYRRKYGLTFEQGGFVANVDQDQVLHVAGPSWSSYRGQDPAVIGREALGLAQSTEETHARLFANSARPSGVLSTNHRLTQEQVDKLREQWAETMGGTANTGKPVVSSGGLTWQQLAMTGVDAQHLETRKHQIEEIARLVGVFPIMLGHAGDQSPTFASADAFLEAHVRYSLQPWIKAVRSAIETQLLTKDERLAGYHCRIDTSELLRGSLKDRTEYYKAALGTNSSRGWLKPNEIREDDGWNPDDEPAMDKVWQPATMAPSGETPAAANDDDAGRVAEAKASAPRTLYVHRRLRNADELLAWARAQGFRTLLPAAELHVTIAWSRAKLDWMAVDEGWGNERDGGLTVRAGGPRVVERIGREGAVALLFSSSELSWRNMAIREVGASWDHPDYQPHVTLTYDPGDVNIEKVEPFRGELRFGPEIFAEIDDAALGGGPNADRPFADGAKAFSPRQPRGKDGRWIASATRIDAFAGAWWMAAPRLFERLFLGRTRLAGAIRQATGERVGGYSYSLSNLAVRHIRKQHGNPAREARRGQVAMQAQDLKHLPEALSRAAVTKGRAGKLGSPRVFARGQAAGRTFNVVLQVNHANRELAIVTAWRSK